MIAEVVACVEGAILDIDGVLAVVDEVVLVVKCSHWVSSALVDLW